MEGLLRGTPAAQPLQVLAYDRIAARVAFGLKHLVQPHGGEILVGRQPRVDPLDECIELRAARCRRRRHLALECRLALRAPRAEIFQEPMHGVAMDAEHTADRALRLPALLTALRLIGEAPANLILHARRRFGCAGRS